MVGYIYQRPEDQWTHNLVQASGDTVMYQDIRASSHLSEMQPRNGQARVSNAFQYSLTRVVVSLGLEELTAYLNR
ncbi:unnamed protein product [Nezara viridula]|uniref:Uncharacterized protein n=1 Tax=Nezara viridula TaxID=85310 RepID=A0A9P0HKT3_NEZVI|nr:unnamed protein product [Nezara viridula]